MENKTKAHYLIVLAVFFAISCKNETKKMEEISTKEATEEINVIGNYVSEGYTMRSEGYDWVAVSVMETPGNQLNISVRSRSDKKKPTCTFDAVASKMADHVYETEINGKTIQFEFTNSQVSISSKEEMDGLLYFYCSGGASIGGTYSKINEPLDQSQIDKTKFSKTLNLQGVGFNISSIEKDGKNTLTIFTFGLQESEYNETLNIEGEDVVNAEVEDLNSDGSPELFIYTRSVGSGSYGNVYAFSVNNKKSMSRVYFQPTAENTEINKGYMGHDQFSLVEIYLGQRFPIYKDGDSNANPTGGTRQVMYKLVEGEAMRKLEVDNISEY
ncbi:PliI family lysozyme inhibitor of I-type lysozyme [Winogradskyella poriferorum]|uniref:PliI family lysozyme inhibitor of I-type lysozyme n=1 Tax=Winogradskyella poriferorum TaxID=307627 RepID=UPI003D65809C